MSDDKRRILDMLAAGSLNVDEAERLLRACEAVAPQDPEHDPKPQPRYLKLVAEEDGPDESSVTVTVPLTLIRAGIKLHTLLPEGARERTVEGFKVNGIGIDPFDIPADKVDEFIEAFSELEIEANESGSRFRLYME